jgi:catechol 2,3-dioxygenase-like lactoylglutathione lyase family enzyme
MRIKWTTLYVDDQEKALQFYTEKLGAVLDDTRGNLIQLTQLTWGPGA